MAAEGFSGSVGVVGFVVDVESQAEPTGTDAGDDASSLQDRTDVRSGREADDRRVTRG